MRSARYCKSRCSAAPCYEKRRLRRTRRAQARGLASNRGQRMPNATPSYARYGFFPALAALLCATTAQADPTEDFYKGKTVTIVTSTGVGGPFDLTARALAKHIPKYVPGKPTMIVR